MSNDGIQSIELLAPARNLECGIAAIDHGADAVYIGPEHFGARHAVGNSMEDIASLVVYAHQFKAKVYATVNTIIFNNEMRDAVSLVKRLLDNGVDAILIQDMGLMAMLQKEGFDLDSMRFHASTQTDNRTVEKVRWLRDRGFSRVVLARELSLDDIREIHNSVPDVELEVFVHGALCVSYSGQCYASQHCFGRSANRGECAQFCRLKFGLVDADGKPVERDAYYLSLKDMCQIDHLEDIIEAGASSLKIEGRLKDVSYVKNVVAAYSRRLDKIVAQSNGKLRRASIGRTELQFVPDLDKTFNRGFTNYFLHGRRENVASFMTPKAMGEYVGKVKELRGDRSFNVAGTASFANGDGLCFVDTDGNLKGFRVNRAEGNRLYPHVMPRELKPGTPLYRNQDQQQDKLMARQTAVRSIPLIMRLVMSDDNTLVLTVQDTLGYMQGEATLQLEEVQTAQKPQLENIKRQLTKLGGTAFSCESIEIAELLDKVFVPSSMVADMRRRALQSIKEQTEEKPEHERTLNFDGAADKPELYNDKYQYLLNASNDEAIGFYKGGFAYETQKPQEGMLLMQCRHCLRYAMGHCVKHGGVKPTWKEPLRLVLPDGNTFPLEFDCRRCQMNVYSK